MFMQERLNPQEEESDDEKLAYGEELKDESV